MDGDEDGDGERDMERVGTGETEIAEGKVIKR